MFDNPQTDQSQNLDNNSEAPAAGTSIPSLGGVTDNTAEDTSVAPVDVTATDPLADLPADPAPQPDAPVETVAPVASGSTDLDRIKIKALEDLSPIVNKLDQTPEEKYKTVMMLIQASDNQDLVKDAYAAAQDISDEKAKAEALLTIVNEINYFTQSKS